MCIEIIRKKSINLLHSTRIVLSLILLPVLVSACHDILLQLLLSYVLPSHPKQLVSDQRPEIG